MNSGREEEQLIEQFKEEFHKRTGKYVVISLAKKQYESDANFTDRGEFWKIVKIIFDYTGWTKATTFTVSRLQERVFRRSLIDYIAVHNGCVMTHCARFTNRDHTTVIHSLQNFENRIETDMYSKQLFREIISYAKENYHLYKNRVIGESDVD